MPLHQSRGSFVPGSGLDFSLSHLPCSTPGCLNLGTVSSLDPIIFCRWGGVCPTYCRRFSNIPGFYVPDISWHLPQRCLQTLPNAPGRGAGGAKSPLVEGHCCGQPYPSSGLFPISSHAHTIGRSHRPWLCSLPRPARGSSQWDSGAAYPRTAQSEGTQQGPVSAGSLSCPEGPLMH